MYLLTFDTLDKRLLVAQKIYNGIKRVKVLPEYVDGNIETLVDILTNPISASPTSASYAASRSLMS